MQPIHHKDECKDHHSFAGLYRELCFSPRWLYRNCQGYASISAKELGKSKTIPSHRLVAELFIGRQRADDSVLHRCGNAQCHNPYHLYFGSAQDNVSDTRLHNETEPRWGHLHQSYFFGDHEVEMRHPLVLSKNAGRSALQFKGFSPVECFHIDGLAKTSDGYPQLHGEQLASQVAGLHRKIYMLFRGRIDRYDVVRHLCGDMNCLNPYHLTVTAREKKDDWDRKNDKRHNLSPDDKRYKLTPEARCHIAASEEPTNHLAKFYGVRPETIRKYRCKSSPKGTKSDT